MMQPSNSGADPLNSPAIDQQSVEGALRASEERYRSLVNSLDSAVALFDARGYALFANDYAAHALRRTPETMVGRHMTELFSPETAEWQLAALQQVMQTGQGQVFEGPTTVGSETRWYRTSVQPVRDAQNAVTGALINALDITQSKLTEHALRASEAQFRGLLETAPEAVIICDISGNIRLSNAKAQAIFGYSAAELMGQNIDLLVPEESRPVHVELVADYVRQPRNRHLNSGFQTKARRRDGTYFPVEIGLGYSQYADELVIMCFVVDVTSRQQAEATLKYQASLLQRVSDAIITVDADKRVTSWNKAAAYVYGWSEAEALGQILPELLQADFQKQTLPEVWALIQSGAIWRGEIVERTKDGQIRWILSSVTNLYDGDQSAGAVIVNRDITERKRREILQKRMTQILERVAISLPLSDTLDQLARAIEEYEPEVRASVLLLDPTGERLLLGAAPSLPEAYNTAIQGIRIGPQVGSCGTAAYEKRLVLVEDIETDPLWTDYKVLALAHGLRACWSQPIMADEHTVLGTFALYYGQPRLPGEAELELIDLAAHIAGIAMRRVQIEAEKQRVQAALQGSYDLLELRVGERTAELESAKNQIEQQYEEARVMQTYLRALHEASIVLARTESLDAFYQTAVQLGRDSFGFDRMGMVLSDPEHQQIVGTYGCDMDGKLINEYDVRLPFDSLPEIYQTTMERGVRFAVNESAPLYDRPKFVAVGSQAVAALWDDDLLGWVSVDNAIQHRPFSKAQLEALSLYAMTIGSLLARKIAEEKAISLSQRLDMATQAGEIGIMEWDLQKRVTMWDERMCIIHGIPKADEPFPEEWINNFIHPDDRAGAEERAKRAWQENPHSDAFRIVRPDGEIRHLNLHSVTLFGDNGLPTKIIGAAWDITEHKHSEEALRQALAAEQELGELKSRFVSMASHEFRTPLAAIMALAESLSIYRHKMDDAQIERRLEKIRQQVDHMIAIMDDVLQLARLQTGRMEFVPAPGDLDALCRDVIEELDIQSSNRGRIVYTAPELAPALSFDVRLMRQVIHNLLANALKYSPADKIVKLKLSQDNVNIYLQVIDEGIGIPPDDQKYLFEPFHRGRNVGTIPGTGLGLSITKQFVELHGGTINVASEVDAGTTFIVTMPIDPFEDSADGKDTGC
ncbi:MAG: PAS domain S-box protein [Chloroflexi bacterium]|uniref:PAS domain S-box protein n=1 Tax=Candidatus Flexifilum breve TaxID=3140694 RepID=UPI003134A6FA|nr:PAS domain S-box protein [Chloroflexota bacterium]